MPAADLVALARAPMDPSSRNRIWIRVVLLGGAAILVLLTQRGILRWNSPTETLEEIDIDSGRIRITRHRFFVRVEQTVAPSPLTEALDPTDYAHSPDWRQVTSFQPGFMGAHSSLFGRAIHQAQTLGQCWGAGTFTSAARRESAVRLRAIWHRDGKDRAADSFITALGIKVSRMSGSQTIDVLDLPTIDKPKG
jgi:hypothetical protein